MTAFLHSWDILDFLRSRKCDRPGLERTMEKKQGGHVHGRRYEVRAEISISMNNALRRSGTRGSPGMQERAQG